MSCRSSSSLGVLTPVVSPNKSIVSSRTLLPSSMYDEIVELCREAVQLKLADFKKEMSTHFSAIADSLKTTSDHLEKMKTASSSFRNDIKNIPSSKEIASSDSRVAESRAELDELTAQLEKCSISLDKQSVNLSLPEELEIIDFFHKIRRDENRYPEIQNRLIWFRIPKIEPISSLDALSLLKSALSTSQNDEILKLIEDGEISAKFISPKMNSSSDYSSNTKTMRITCPNPTLRESLKCELVYNKAQFSSCLQSSYVNRALLPIERVYHKKMLDECRRLNSLYPDKLFVVRNFSIVESSRSHHSNSQ